MYELTFSSPYLHLYRNCFLRLKSVRSSLIPTILYSSRVSAHSMNFSKPKVTVKNNAANTENLITSKLPVKARTLKIYDIEAPTPAAT